MAEFLAEFGLKAERSRGLALLASLYKSAEVGRGLALLASISSRSRFPTPNKIWSPKVLGSHQAKRPHRPSHTNEWMTICFRRSSCVFVAVVAHHSKVSKVAFQSKTCGNFKVTAPSLGVPTAKNGQEVYPLCKKVSNSHNFTELGPRNEFTDYCDGFPGSKILG
eukprot:g51412.t1